MDTPPPPSWCTTSILAYGRLHQQLLESASFCLSVFQRLEDKISSIPGYSLGTIQHTIISLVAGYIVVILSERAAESQSNTFSLLPKGYLRQEVCPYAVVCCFGETKPHGFKPLLDDSLEKKNIRFLSEVFSSLICDPFTKLSRVSLGGGRRGHCPPPPLGSWNSCNAQYETYSTSSQHLT